MLTVKSHNWYLPPGVQVDRSDLDLPGGQLPLLQALTATGTPVVVLLLHGRQMTFGRNNVGLDGKLCRKKLHILRACTHAYQLGLAYALSSSMN